MWWLSKLGHNGLSWCNKTALFVHEFLMLLSFLVATNNVYRNSNMKERNTPIWPMDDTHPKGSNENWRKANSCKFARSCGLLWQRISDDLAAFIMFRKRVWLNKRFLKNRNSSSTKVLSRLSGFILPYCQRTSKNYQILILCLKPWDRI